METEALHKKKLLAPKLRFKAFTGNWNESLLDEVAVRGSGHTPNKSFANYYNGEIKWVSLADSKRLDNGYIEDTEIKISLDGIKNSSAVLHPKESVLLSRDAGVGKSAVMKTEMAVSQHFIVWQGRINILSNWFLYHILQILKPEFERIAVGSTIKTIGLPYFKKLKIAIPLYQEQQKIASFLSAVDEKIQQLTRKKELLEQYKKGVMQQLFSGKLRFKDANGKSFPKWEEKLLSDLFYCVKGNGLSKDKLNSAGIYECILYGQLYTTYREVVRTVSSKTNSKEGELSNIGDLLVPSSTTTTGIDLANVTALNIENVLLGGDITVLRTKEKIDNIFYAYYLSNFKKHKIASYAQGSTIIHLSYNHLKLMKIDFPCFEEQNLMANLLVNIDTKIEDVTKKITQTQTFKKGLLQQMFV